MKRTEKFPWITISILSVLIIILLMINHSDLSTNIKTNIVWGMTGLVFLSMFTFVVLVAIKAFKNEKRFKKFRKSLKIGDLTSEGIVMDIEGDEVTIAKTTKIHLVYPPTSPEDNINFK